MAEKEIRLIDADAFYEKHKHYGLQNGTSVGRHSGMAEYLLEELMKAPTIKAYTEQDVRDAYNDGYSTGVEQCREKAVVHGKWIPYYEEVEIYNTGGFTERKQTGWICGRCKSKKSFTPYYKTNYCPNCGAKMEG